MLVAKSDLALKHYSWTAKPGDNPRVKGHPDSDLFNRDEGYEVLSMIQGVVTALSLKTAGDVHKLEQLIAYDLPGGIRSRQGVKDWLMAQMKLEPKSRLKLKLSARDLLKKSTEKK